MTTLFSQDSALMRGMSYLTDAVWLTILTVVACLPVVTIGAAWCASYETARTLGSGEGHMTRRFADAFRSNLVKATGLWLVMGVTGAAIAASWMFIQITPLLVVKFAATILWLIMAVWVWPLQARFENPVGRTLRNALLIGISQIVRTIAVVLVWATFGVLLAASLMLFPQGLFLLVLLGPGLVSLAHEAILRPVIASYSAGPSAAARS